MHSSHLLPACIPPVGCPHVAARVHNSHTLPVPVCQASCCDRVRVSLLLPTWAAPYCCVCVQLPTAACVHSSFMLPTWAPPCNYPHALLPLPARVHGSLWLPLLPARVAPCLYSLYHPRAQLPDVVCTHGSPRLPVRAAPFGCPFLRPVQVCTEVGNHASAVC